MFKYYWRLVSLILFSYLLIEMMSELGETQIVKEWVLGWDFILKFIIVSTSIYFLGFLSGKETKKESE